MKSELESRYLELLRKAIKSKEEIEEQDTLRELLTHQLKQEISELSQELEKAGCKYNDPWDMVNTKEPYPEAIDILIKHVPKPYHDKNKEGIIRALTVKEAKGKANAILIEEYNKIPKEKDSLRWVIGNAIYVIITPKDIESILSIVEDKTNGMSRSRFVSALGKLKSEEAEDSLIKLLDDGEMTLHALQSLERMKSKKAKEKIRLLTDSLDASIKMEAQKALSKLR